MKIDELISSFRNSEYSKNLIDRILKFSFPKKIRIMEVCGGHTISLLKHGIHEVLSPLVELISGPGCPVCVTSSSYINNAIELSQRDDVILTTYGDMLKLPGSKSSLWKEKISGRDIRICYSILDSLKIAKENPNKKVIFLAIGFETTAPSTAVTLLKAEEKKISNFGVLCAHKTMPQAMRLIAIDPETNIDAFILPGHVSTITGTSIFDFLIDEFNKPSVVSGFEPLDLLHSIYMILEQLKSNQPKLEIQYTRVVNRSGNKNAQDAIAHVFQEYDAEWKGLGLIPKSGLELNSKFQHRDVTSYIPLTNETSKDNPACICNEVLKGKKIPTDCKLFAKVCKPENPIGACMVSVEGTCGNYFKYK